MPPIEINSILESLIELTSLRDQNALEICLAQVLFELVAPGAVHMYRVQQGESGPDFLPAENMGVTYEITPELRSSMLESLSSMERTVVPTDRATTLIYPLTNATRGVVALIVLESSISKAHLHHSAALVLKIYHNLLALINDNQQDTLTGLLNRKTFEARLGKILSDAQFYGQREGEDTRRTSFLAILDIDHFKRINDEFGHLVGDEVLLLFASLMTKLFRADDLLFRFGGEEFVCVIRDVNLEVAEKALHRFRQAVENHLFPQAGQVTVSIGYTQIGPNDLSTTLIDRADEALYYAKRNGRNQICSYETLIREGKLESREIAGDIELFDQ